MVQDNTEHLMSLVRTMVNAKVLAVRDRIKTVRAAWNYILVKYDGSKDIHNPTYTRALLLATVEALR